MSVPIVVGETVMLPDPGSVPVHAPEAVQLVAFADDQVSVAELPTLIEVGATVTVGVGAVSAVTVSVALAGVELPAASAQLSVYV